MKCPKQPALACPISNIGVSARLMAAFNVFFESHEPPPSGDARGIVLPHHDGHQNGQQSVHMLHHHRVDCHPGGRRCDTERAVAQWQRPVASDEALEMLHWAMLCALLQRLHMTIEMACKGGTFAHCRRYFA